MALCIVPRPLKVDTYKSILPHIHTHTHTYTHIHTHTHTNTPTHTHPHIHTHECTQTRAHADMNTPLCHIREEANIIERENLLFQK
jgi:hypothetical protein